MIKKKRLFFDIETSFNEGWFFRAGFKQNINYEQITKERAVICICYKWEGEKTIHSLTWKNGNDKAMLKEFVKIAEDAAEIVGHNGDRYDLNFFRTRLAYHRLSLSPFIKVRDTLKFAKSKFMFNSNRLDYIGQFLGVGKKIKTGGYSLWVAVTNGDKIALAKMVKYCKGDVKLLEDVFNVLAPFVPSVTHFGVINGRKQSDCPECGGETIVNKHIISAAGTSKTQLKCKSCGRCHTVATSKLRKAA